MDHLLRVPHPVAVRVGVVRRVLQRLEGQPVGGLQQFEGGRAALLHRPDPVRLPDGDQQVLTGLVLEELDVLRALHLVADDLEGDPEVPRVLLVLAVDGDALAGRFGHQEGHVEAGEHAGGEGVRAGRHVDDDVLVRAVREVVEAELDRADLGVVAGHPEVGLGERPRGHQPHGLPVEQHGACAGFVDGVVLVDPQQPGAGAGRSGLDHRVGGRDARVGAPQVVLDEGQVRAQRGQRGRLVLAEPERRAQVLVDVGVHRDDTGFIGGEVADEKGGQRGLAAAALPHESDLHVHEG